MRRGVSFRSVFLLNVASTILLAYVNEFLVGTRVSSLRREIDTLG